MNNEQTTSAPKLWVILARTYNAVAVYLESTIAAEGLGLSDFAALEVLLHKGPLTMSAIAEKVLLANASMTSAIDRLDERGLVRRVNSESDRRVRIVELTAQGRTFISAIYERHERELDALMGGLSQAERNQLRHLLKKLGYAASVASRANKEEHQQ